MCALSVDGLVVEVPSRRLLNRVDLQLDVHESLAVMGPSGSGKTSLLNCLSGIVRPMAGRVIVDGTEISALSPGKRAAFRLRNIGLVFQFGELLPELSVLENVALPSRLLGLSRVDSERRAAAWLERFGLENHAAKHPDALSGGEVQRVGIARALAHEPKLVLADEPTGALDEANVALVSKLLTEQAKELGAAVVIATHDPAVAGMADRVVRLREGELEPVESRLREVHPVAVDMPETMGGVG